MNPTTDAERSDTERLDWMIANVATISVESNGFRTLSPRFWIAKTYPTSRQAIDAAMSLTQETPK